MLNCSCSHNRLDHVGGENTIDSRVLKCESQGCLCKKYHGAKENSDSYIYKSLSIALVFAFIGVGGFIFISIGIDYTLAGYTIEAIEPIDKTFLVYENGTKVNTDNNIFNESIDIVSIIKIIVGMTLFFMLYIIGAIFIEPVFTRAKKEAINSK